MRSDGAARRLRGQVWRARQGAAGVRRRYRSYTTLYTRTVLWLTMAICAALLVSTLSEAWTGAGVERQVQQAQAENARLRQDAAATAHRIAWAQAPATIEDEARAEGYVRPGEQAVVVAAGQPSQPAPAAHATQPSQSAPRGNGAGQTGLWPDWLRAIFGG